MLGNSGAADAAAGWSDDARNLSHAAGTAQALSPGACPFPLTLSGAAAASAAPPAAALPPDGEPRCFWTLLSTRADASAQTEVSSGVHDDEQELFFVYVDPMAQRHLGVNADGVLGRSFLDFVHPDGRAQAREDIHKIIQSRTLFGSVTRCRYARLDSMRRQLSGEHPGDAGGAKEYAELDVVINWVADGMALAFFHTVEGATGVPSAGCGTPAGMFDAAQCAKIWHQVASHYGTAPRRRRLFHVFQVLTCPQEPDVLFSWPPPRLERNVPDTEATYAADEFARLAHGIQNETGAPADGPSSSSCTRRFRAMHNLVASGRTRSIASVLIPYGSVVLACFHISSDDAQGHAPDAPPAAPRVKRAHSELEAAEHSTPPPAHVHASPPVPEGVSSGGSPPAWKTESHTSFPLLRPPLGERTGGEDSGPGRSLPASGNVATLAAVAAVAAAQNKTCSSCGQSNSPEWRRGPSGHKTLCNACGLRYARSLSSKRKKGKDGQVVTVEGTGDPGTVPPSRGSGGGSRPGVHRRSSKRTQLSEESATPPTPQVPAPAVPEGNAKLAHTTAPALSEPVVAAAAAAAAADTQLDVQRSGAPTEPAPGHVPMPPAPAAQEGHGFLSDAATANAAAAAVAATARDARLRESYDPKALYQAILSAQAMPQHGGKPDEAMLPFATMEAPAAGLAAFEGVQPPAGAGSTPHSVPPEPLPKTEPSSLS